MFSLHIDTARTWRGGQNQVLLTVLGLRSLGHRAALVAHPDGVLRQRVSEGLELVPLAPRGEMDLRAGWRLSKLLKKLRPDIIHAHDSHAVAMAALALSIGASTPAPPLIAARRVDFHVHRNAFSRWKYDQVDCFIAASEAIRLMLIADGVPPDRAVTVHEGVDIDRVHAAETVNAHAAFWLPTHAPLVGNVAALVPHKGQRHLIDAAPLVLRDWPDTRFLIVGEGELRPALEKQVRDHRLEKHVILTGFRADVLSLHKAFDVFVLSSITEGLGTSLLDAMASAKPVVATRTGGIPEVVIHRETGILVSPREPSELADGILELLRDAELRRAMGQAGLARVKERFTVERMVRETAAVYDRLAGKRHAADISSRDPTA